MTATMPDGAPAWADSVTTDFDADLAFYTGLFGWTPVGFGPEVEYYVDFHAGGRAIGGLVGASPAFLPGVPSRWTVYFRTPDCADAVARATDLGADVVIPASPVGGDLVYALLEDPAGAHFGLFEIRSGTAGLQASGEPGAPAWFTYAATDLDAPLDFYRRLLDWSVEDGLTAAGAAAPFGAAHRAEREHGWTVYYEVDSVDAAASRASELGGTLGTAPLEAAGHRLAVLTAPSGARFGVAAPIR
ncbi:hypothetical protein SAMN05216298_3077 [Glycomyces sambucus]|uniref:VOC domain-containing protein n=1 Tax=Glycomyces sambucus TaxID=380244 RepID=A0A1G9I7A5_9ACTN|nr:VOC family protein [Glycomyces sambucus]SDL21147.1 hypothetical protein SAMN05216298_3077 [Glycomyces sambucus]